MSFESPRFAEPPDEGGPGDSAADDDDDPLASPDCGDDVGPGCFPRPPRVRRAPSSSAAGPVLVRSSRGRRRAAVLRVRSAPAVGGRNFRRRRGVYTLRGHSPTAVRCPLRLMKTSTLSARRTSVNSGSGTAVARYSGEPVIRACGGDAKIKTESRE
ncbi:hypothetical protein MRX96_033603 [Rhipicephalus microplus]